MRKIRLLLCGLAAAFVSPSIANAEKIPIDGISGTEIISGNSYARNEWKIRTDEVVQSGIIHDKGGSTARLSTMIIHHVAESPKFTSDKTITFGNFDCTVYRGPKGSAYMNSNITATVKEILTNKSTGAQWTRTTTPRALFEFAYPAKGLLGLSAPWDFIFTVPGGPSSGDFYPLYEQHIHFNWNEYKASSAPAPKPGPTQ
jgi:hypothetical protein